VIPLSKLKKRLIQLTFCIGATLLAINIYGLFQNMRVNHFFNSELRFYGDQPTNYQQTMTDLTRKQNETDRAYAMRVTQVIDDGLAHIHWERYDPAQFNQRIPVWENYFLHFMGKFSTIPEYRRYQFADYKKSLKRGIGICGDASMILSQVLDLQGIENTILSFPGHVVVLATFNNGEQAILDADFGVTAMTRKPTWAQNPDTLASRYVNAGYTKTDESFFLDLYRQEFQEWRDVEHFITKKYYFEHVSYALKWPLPMLLILISILYLRKLKPPVIAQNQ